MAGINECKTIAVEVWGFQGSAHVDLYGALLAYIAHRIFACQLMKLAYI